MIHGSAGCTESGRSSAFRRACHAALVLCLLESTSWLSGGVSAQQSPAAVLVPRQVAAGPEDILSGLVRLPEPRATAVWSQSALLRLRFEAQPSKPGVWLARAQLPLAGLGRLSLLPLAPSASQWEVELIDPSGTVRSLEQLRNAGRAQQMEGRLDELLPGFQARRTDLQMPREAGRWELKIQLGTSTQRTVAPEAYLLLKELGEGSEPSAVLESWLATHALVAGDPIGVLASWDAGGAALARDVTQDVTMMLHVRAPQSSEPAGKEWLLPMADDGLHSDGVAGDGVFGAIMPALPRGNVFAQVLASGADAQGRTVLRSAEHAFQLVERSAVLSGEVTTTVLDDTRLGLDIGAWVFAGAESAPKLHVSTEVWGTGPSGELQPVCWLSSMVTPRPGMSPGAGAALPLALDVRWLNRAGVTAPLELRALRIQDPDTEVPVDTWDRVRLEDVAAPLLWGAPPGAILKDMTMGPSPVGVDLRAGGATTTVGGTPAPFLRGLLLSHGYCSGGGIWPSQDFTGQAIQFNDPDQNRSHDAFAQLLGDFGSQLDSFGLLAHSQGGNAGLHLFTYYQSGLDMAQGGRLIQAVASPWLGSPLASTLAGLGGIFGVGCGSNDDLSSGGATVWLAGIPSWARSEVFFWTTQNSGSACNSLTNLFLSSPNDGVVERSKGILSGGNNMGHISGWCHSTGMSNSANYLDHALNLLRNAAAAR